MQTTTAVEREPLDAIFEPLVNPQTYRNLLYLLLSFPLGIFYFVFLITGISTGAGMLVVFVGLPILLGTLFAAGLLADMEMRIARALLGVETVPAVRLPLPAGWIDRAKTIVTDARLWRSVLYLMLRFPTGIAAFVLVVTGAAVSVSLLLTPLAYHVIPIEIAEWPIDSGQAAFFAGFLGLVLLLLWLHAMNAFARLWGRFAAFLLT